MFVEWIEDYSVGDEKIDAQHQQLFNMVNELYSANEKDDLGSAYNVLEKLKEYAATHFEDEEQLMKRIGCPLLEEQESEHAAFKDKISEYVFMEATTPDYVPMSEMLDFLKVWLVEHITEKDRKIKEYLPNE